MDKVKMLCGEGYKTEATNGTVFDLNYPSFALSTVEKHFSATYRRNVTNVGDAVSTYKASVSGAPGLRMTVEPDVLTFGAQGEQPAFVLKVEGEAADGTLSGALTWSDEKHKVRSPIAIYLA
ncbi:hypothetical protein HPP92_026780 [Vanilla planifolia]|uniref:Subtilisin-like protease fibronectin type-III domain-containing protein n=1 Tax=Vanilla planifolia TaxID=51239 RepID=A0A835U5I8_VANPL|nr:hypothetical protein HPP92_026780 [Vanilla planifolia]